MLGGDDGRTLLMCVAPDFLEHNRTGASDALLVTTTVDVPRAGLPRSRWRTPGDCRPGSPRRWRRSAAWRGRSTRPAR